MSQYITTPAQSAYLKRRAIMNKKNARCCDCAGCDKCKGFVTGCLCDEESIHDILMRVRGQKS